MPQTLVISSGDVQPGNCFTKQTGIVNFCFSN